MKAWLTPQRFLVIYSAALTVTLAGIVGAGIAFKDQKQKFSEIDVQRLNIVEPDGTRRFAIARDEDRSVAFFLKDPEGRDRLVLRVTPEGTPLIEFMDESGHTIDRVAALSH
ncbi:hypothetical protein LZC95_26100 [Pendulispora brunnea]|uniref:Uncharacterized protein n=1 Tax=Pendulispora brunnea TaxID=2905690 RepID=A0ABZ2JXZ8_9BACT